MLKQLFPWEAVRQSRGNPVRNITALRLQFCKAHWIKPFILGEVFLTVLCQHECVDMSCGRLVFRRPCLGLVVVLVHILLVPRADDHQYTRSLKHNAWIIGNKNIFLFLGYFVKYFGCGGKGKTRSLR